MHVLGGGTARATTRATIAATRATSFSMLCVHMLMECIKITTHAYILYMYVLGHCGEQLLHHRQRDIRVHYKSINICIQSIAVMALGLELLIHKQVVAGSTPVRRQSFRSKMMMIIGVCMTKWSSS